MTAGTPKMADVGLLNMKQHQSAMMMERTRKLWGDGYGGRGKVHSGELACNNDNEVYMTPSSIIHIDIL